MATVQQSLEGYIDARKNEVPYADLLGRWQWGMETQIQVRTDHGEPVEGRRSTFTDGREEWWHIRVPKNADSDPIFPDYDLPWVIRHHVQSIGSTGWNWLERRSVWMGADFDALIGHAAGVGISDSELNEVRMRASQIPWVEIRKSTRGLGTRLSRTLRKAGSLGSVSRTDANYRMI